MRKDFRAGSRPSLRDLVAVQLKGTGSSSSLGLETTINGDTDGVWAQNGLLLLHLPFYQHFKRGGLCLFIACANCTDSEEMEKNGNEGLGMACCGVCHMTLQVCIHSNTHSVVVSEIRAMTPKKCRLA